MTTSTSNQKQTRPAPAKTTVRVHPETSPPRDLYLPRPQHHQPILDMLNLVCTVHRASDGVQVSAHEYLEQRFSVLQLELDTRTGETDSGRYRKILRHPSHKQSFYTVRTIRDDRLLLHGNPTMWLQGHNAFCRASPQRVARAAFKSLSSMLRVEGYVIRVHHVSTIHLAMMYDALSVERAQQLFEALKYQAFLGTIEKSIPLDDNTLYFGKSSKRKSLKFYLATTKPYPGADRSYMGRMLRGELVLHSEELAALLGGSGTESVARFFQTDWAKVFALETRTLRMLAHQFQREQLPQTLTPTEIGYVTMWRTFQLQKPKQSIRKIRNSIVEKGGPDIFAPPSPIPTSAWIQERPLLAMLRDRNVTNFPPPFS